MGNRPTQPEWMDLRTLADYACVSQKTLREWIRDVGDPLPAFQRGNKLYVNRQEYDRWLRQHPVASGAEINRIVDEIVASVRE